MKFANIHIGSVYLAKVSGSVVPVRLTAVSRYGGWDAVNTTTGRAVRIRTAGRLRGEQVVASPALPPISGGSWAPYPLPACEFAEVTVGD